EYQRGTAAHIAMGTFRRKLRRFRQSMGQTGARRSWHLAYQATQLSFEARRQRDFFHSGRRRLWSRQRAVIGTDRARPKAWLHITHCVRCYFAKSSVQAVQVVQNVTPHLFPPPRRGGDEGEGLNCLNDLNDWNRAARAARERS